MKKLTKLGLLAVIMLITVMLLTGCGQQGEEQKKDELEGLAVYTEEETSDYTTFTEMAGVELKYPSNYVSIGKETQPMFMDPDVTGASFNLVTDTFPSALTFEGYVEASLPGIKSQMTIKDNNINVEYINLNGRKAAKLDYVASSQGQTMALTQILVKKDNKAYVLTLASSEADKDAVSEKFDKIIKSFK